ncbi:methyl-accepting chemotaxis protein [Castellaniella hirudinis]|uniref:methyl-accepting chemotaxis protein n=1 Tax=Castellaniella hirudinis TaxID=1144617 RepID=UPI0039C11E3E
MTEESIYVSGRERRLDAADRIVLTTDLDGRITYVNRDFLRISGHAAEEVIGASQAILRHPHMPREPFADLMHTVRQGRSWSGLLKNRCKNGDHYWVRVDAAPLFHEGRVAGYTSIRTRPERAQIDQADQAYRALAQGEKRIAIQDGRIVRHRRGRRMRSWALKYQLMAYGGGMLLIAGLQAAWPWEPVLAAAWLLLLGLWAVAGGIGLHQALAGPLKRLRGEIECISAGDLSRALPVDQAVEIARLAHGLRIVQINMKLLLVRILEATEVVVIGVRDIARGGGDLSSRTDTQASSLEETAAAIEQLAGSVRLNTESARQATRQAGTLQQLVGQGEASMAAVVRTMDDIQQEARRIADITSVIDGIAFQTNILALNASVEAARAGPQGRGFAVVAAEVRTLAQRTTEAAHEIEARIAASVRAVDTGAGQVSQARQVSTGIGEAADRFADLVREIALACQEQEQGIGEISQAASQIDQAARSSAGLVGQVAHAADHIHEQAEALQALVGSFSLFESSTADRPAAPLSE